MKNPASLTTIANLFHEVRKFGYTRKQVEDFLHTQASYTQHRRILHKHKHRMVTSPCLNDLFQADLIILDKFSRYNSGYKYLLTVIDVLSKFAFVIPLKKKTAEATTKAFEYIFTIRKPSRIQSDFGREFFNHKLQKLLDNEGIVLFSTYSKIKAAVVERFNKTLMQKIQRYMTQHNTKRYINVLDDIVRNYNFTIHSATGMKPSDVNDDNQHDAWFKMYKKVYNARKEKPSFQVNDFVRIKIDKKLFDKGYATSFSDTIYTIKEVLPTIALMYKVCEGNKEILGSFHKEELVKVL